MATAVPSRGANVAHRLDRLPISSVHRLVLIALTFAYFFELGDLNTFAFAAPALIKYWHLPITTIGFITSATFFFRSPRRSPSPRSSRLVLPSVRCLLP
jgi:hypothetical protein